MGKVGKISIVVMLAVVVGGVLAVKRGGEATSSTDASTKVIATQPALQRAVSLPRLVDLGSTTCIPCKMMAPILEDLKTKYVGQMQVEFIDVNVSADAAKAFGIKLIPTQVFLDASGRELYRHEGFFSREDILAKWNELGVSIGSPAERATTTVPAALPLIKRGSS